MMSVLPSNSATVLTIDFRDATASDYPEHPMCPPRGIALGPERGYGHQKMQS
jgi:hypothetical protein